MENATKVNESIDDKKLDKILNILEENNNKKDKWYNNKIISIIVSILVVSFGVSDRLIYIIYSNITSNIESNYNNIVRFDKKIEKVDNKIYKIRLEIKIWY